MYRKYKADQMSKVGRLISEFEEKIENGTGPVRNGATSGLTTSENEAEQTNDGAAESRPVIETKNVAEDGMADEEGIIAQCWSAVDRQCLEGPVSVSEEQDTGLGWKTVRLFVSSTFTDFFSEREILVKKVFPELREWCEDRKISLIECDLRWGVPKDTPSKDTICTCLEEIDRCRQENGHPFFLNLLGDRYGWIPTEDDVTDDIRETYNWVPNTSITFMEILCAAYRTRNPNAAFFLRSSDYLKDIPQGQQRRFIDEETLKEKHLKELKNRLRERFPVQTFDYTCHVDTENTADDSGDPKISLAGLEDFADRVLAFFQNAIEAQYTDHQNVQTLDEWEQERQLQFMFIKQKADMTIGRDSEISSLLGFARGGHPSTLEMTPGDNDQRSSTWSEFPDLRTNVTVISPPGFGKTSLMAKVVVDALKSKIEVFYHFVGSTSASCTADNLLERLRRHVGGADITDTQQEIKNEENKDVNKMKLILRALANREEPLLIVLDGVNQLLYRDRAEHLAWLPPGMPGHARCVVSAATEHEPTVAFLLSAPTFRLHLAEVAPETRREIVTASLARFGKRLDPEQLELILAHPCAQQPLWLVIVCEELRVFGDFSALTAKISTLPETLDGLLQEIIHRLITEDATACMEKSLSLIGCALRGLPVIDILNLLGDLTNKEPVPLVTWAHVRRLLKPFIRTVTRGAIERVFFFHQAMELAVKQKLIPGYQERQRWSSHMADYLEYWCERKETKRDELPDYLRDAGLKERLVNFIRKTPEGQELGDFTRSSYLQFCRCNNVATPNSPMTTPMMICMWCGMKSGHFSSKHFRNSESCVVCGAWVPRSFSKKLANICSWHASVMGISKHWMKCYICGHPTKNDRNATQGVFCQMCYMHRAGNTCSLVDQNL